MIDPDPATRLAARTAWIALGANLPGPAGPAPTTLDLAIARIAALPDTALTGRSRRYRSAPVDATGPDYLNQVVRVQTRLDPALLLGHLHAIEAALGRVRTGSSPRNPPRSLDLDLLLVATDDAMDAAPPTPSTAPPDPAARTDPAGQPGVTVQPVPPTLPHPRMHLRLFVLKPLNDLDPDLVIPGHGRVRDCLTTVTAADDQDCEPVDG